LAELAIFPPKAEATGSNPVGCTIPFDDGHFRLR